MNSEQREKFRWQFAGQAMQCIYQHAGEADISGSWADSVAKSAIHAADALIAELEKSAPKECEHVSDGIVYTSMPPQYKCTLCGEFYKK